MFSSLSLKFTDSPAITLPTKGVTIFVGPNNSGKSLVLKEFEIIAHQIPTPSNLKIVSDFEIAWPTETELAEFYNRFGAFQPENLGIGQILLGHINPSNGFQSMTLHKDALKDIASQKTEKFWWAAHIARWGFVRLDGRSRFELTNDQTGGDLNSPSNVLANLFKNDPLRKKVQDIILDAFGLYLAVDPTNLGSLRIKLSRDPPISDEQSLNAAARDYHQKAIHIKEASDGVQAFVGIVVGVGTGDFHSVLIDEPEAFLHPPLARKLGRHLAKTSLNNGGTLMASTHSPDFLMGCIQGSKDVRIVRLEYAAGKSRGKLIDPAALESLLKRPLMRSANVVSALFHDGVVVTESDNDRVFYAEIYYRLSELFPKMPSILFVNAQNKQTIIDIIGPLRKFGVPAAAIPDIDIVKDGGKTWVDWMEAVQIPSTLQGGFATQRASLKAAFEATGKDMKLDGGIEVLAANDKLGAVQFFDTFAEYGIFAVRKGELENWLPKLAVPGKKTSWTVAMLDTLGNDPSSSSYVRPGEDDVWAFIKQIADWIGNPGRKGTS